MIFLGPDVPIFPSPDGKAGKRSVVPGRFHVLETPPGSVKGWIRVGSAFGKELGWVKESTSLGEQGGVAIPIQPWSTRHAVLLRSGGVTERWLPGQSRLWLKNPSETMPAVMPVCQFVHVKQGVQ